MNEPSATTDPPLLGLALLERYEALLLGQGVPFEEWSSPGLSETEMAEIAAPLPFALPVEARTWWGWRNGSRPGQRSWSFGPSRNCLSLVKAIEEHEVSRELAKELAGEPGLTGPRSDPDFLWPPGWLPLLAGGALKTAVDCDVPEREPSQIVFVDLADQPEEYARHRARSFGEMVGWWCLAIESGAWRWNSARLEWHTDLKLLPEKLDGSPFV